MYCFTYLLALLLLGSSPFVESYPSGAGGCDGNGPAVGGDHLENPVTTGTLADGGLTLVMNGETITEGPITVSLQTLYTFVIEGTADYAGILFRLAPDGSMVDDTTGYLQPAPDQDQTQAAENVCANPVQGVTHTSADLKNDLAAIMEVDVAASYVLDITVVVENDSDNSEYYHSQYQIVAEAAASAPTESAPTTEDGSTPAPAANPSPTPTSSSNASTNHLVAKMILLVASLSAM
jgi:hypothetical protein